MQRQEQLWPGNRCGHLMMSQIKEHLQHASHGTSDMIMCLGIRHYDTFHEFISGINCIVYVLMYISLIDTGASRYTLVLLVYCLVALCQDRP